MSLRLVTPASALAVSLAEAKLHLRVDGTDEDTLITALITAATETAEQITGRAIMPQTWEVTLDEFPTDYFELTRVPVASITSITYIDTDSNTMTLNPAFYQLKNYDDYSFAQVLPAYGLDWPRPSDSPIDTWAEYFINPTVPREGPCLVKLRFVAGNASAAVVAAIAVLGNPAIAPTANPPV